MVAGVHILLAWLTLPWTVVETALSEATDEHIREYITELRYMQSQAQADRQQNVVQNWPQFIRISKEAEKLKSELRALKHLMTELKTNTIALRAATNRTAASGSESDLAGSLALGAGMSKRDKRSSVADRSALWNSQVQVCPFQRAFFEPCLLNRWFRHSSKRLRDRKSFYPQLPDGTSYKMLDSGLSSTMRPTNLGGQCKSFFSTTTF